MLENLFSNYEVNKLDISNPSLINLTIIAILVLLILLTSKRDNAETTQILSRSQTDQLRGIAIYFVILGHLWVHVSKLRANIVLSGVAVSMFLILSGFGLTRSTMNKQLGFRQFFGKRIQRVMMPYWIATIVIVLLDYGILDQALTTYELVMTFLGLNLSKTLRHLDHVRWFVTFLLLWYILFFLCHQLKEKRRATGLLILFSIILFPVHYYFFHFGWYQFFSFPLGCALGVYYEDFKNLYKEKRKPLTIIITLGACFALAYMAAFNSATISNFLVHRVPYIMLACISEVNSIIICFAAIITIGLFGKKKYESTFLLFLGKYSYELFLLHGAFLIKYNPIIRGSGNISVVAGFFLFLASMCGFAFLLNRISDVNYVKKAFRQ